MENIGKTIRELRLSKGISLEQLEEKTKISTRIIEDIEKGDFHKFPAEIYLKGFIRNIFESLGEDYNPIFAEMNQEKKKQKQKKKFKDNQEIFNQKSTNNIRTWFVFINEISFKKYFIFIIIFIILIVSFLLFFFIKSGRGLKISQSDIIKNNETNDKNYEIFRLDAEKESFDLSIGDQVEILLNDKFFSLTLSAINLEEENATFAFKDKIQKFREEGEVIIDLNDDLIEDVSIVVEKINKKIISVFFKSLNYETKVINYKNLWNNKEKRIKVSSSYKLSTNRSTKYIELFIQANHLPSYIEATIDAKKEKTFLLNPLEFDIINAEDTLEITIGNYRTVSLIVNQIPIDLLSPSLNNSSLTNFSKTKIISWIPHEGNETRFDLMIKDNN